MNLFKALRVIDPLLGGVDSQSVDWEQAALCDSNMTGFRIPYSARRGLKLQPVNLAGKYRSISLPLKYALLNKKKKKKKLMHLFLLF